MGQMGLYVRFPFRHRLCLMPLSGWTVDGLAYTRLQLLLDSCHGNWMVCMGKPKRFFLQYQQPMATMKTLATVQLISRKLKKLVLFPPLSALQPLWYASRAVRCAQNRTTIPTFTVGMAVLFWAYLPVAHNRRRVVFPVPIQAIPGHPSSSLAELAGPISR
jgi:hypothetical protein